MTRDGRPSAELARLINGYQVVAGDPCRRHARHRGPDRRRRPLERRPRYRDRLGSRGAVPAAASAGEPGRAHRAGRARVRAHTGGRLPALRRARAARRLGRAHRAALLLGGLGALAAHACAPARTRSAPAHGKDAWEYRRGAPGEGRALRPRDDGPVAGREPGAAGVLRLRPLRARSSTSAAAMAPCSPPSSPRNPEMRGVLFDQPSVVEGAGPLLEDGGRGRPLRDRRRQLLRVRARGRRRLHAQGDPPRLGRRRGDGDPARLPPRDARRRHAARDRARPGPAQRGAPRQAVGPQHAGDPRRARADARTNTRRCSAPPGSGSPASRRRGRATPCSRPCRVNRTPSLEPARWSRRRERPSVWGDVHNHSQGVARLGRIRRRSVGGRVRARRPRLPGPRRHAWPVGHLRGPGGDAPREPPGRRRHPARRHRRACVRQALGPAPAAPARDRCPRSRGRASRWGTR